MTSLQCPCLVQDKLLHLLVEMLNYKFIELEGGRGWYQAS